MTDLPAPAPAPVDLSALWDFSQPALSEERFRQALAAASGDDALILQTQIARSWGLRRDFAQARRILASIEEQLPDAGAEARVRHALELGRSLASATHTPAEIDDEAKRRARAAFESAWVMARSAQLDGLAIDAVHMLAFVDTAPEAQLHWAQEALAICLSSTQTAGRRWEASIRNNLGYALHQLGRHSEALAHFEQAVLLREQALDGRSPQAKGVAVRQAQWMVAWTLRSLQREGEALALQLRLEAENDAAGTPDVYVFEELEILYRDRADEARALHYAERRKGVAGQTSSSR